MVKVLAVLTGVLVELTKTPSLDWGVTGRSAKAAALSSNEIARECARRFSPLVVLVVE